MTQGSEDLDLCLLGLGDGGRLDWDLEGAALAEATLRGTRAGVSAAECLGSLAAVHVAGNLGGGDVTVRRCVLCAGAVEKNQCLSSAVFVLNI